MSLCISYISIPEILSYGCQLAISLVSMFGASGALPDEAILFQAE